MLLFFLALPKPRVCQTEANAVHEMLEKSSVVVQWDADVQQRFRKTLLEDNGNYMSASGNVRKVQKI